jgi:AcrR family transcriptional regulator
MSEAEMDPVSTDQTVVFRRPTPRDAFDLARTTFLANERVDMQTLAAELGIARATLHRWVQTRENLLDHVLGELAAEFFESSRAQATGNPDDVIAETARIIVAATAQFDPVRGFVEREPELALRLLLGERFSVRRNLLGGMQHLIAEVLPEEAEELRGFAEIVVQVGLALAWPTLVAGDEPSGEQIARVARALLAGARAGELPADDP